MALILFAPNIHTGGGRTLLEALDQTCGTSIDQAILDVRLSIVSRAFSSVTMIHVRPRILSRLYAEWYLWRLTRQGDTVLCLHSIPPLLSLKGRVVVLMQNRLLLERRALRGFPWVTRLRIAVERIWAKRLQKRCARYLVQTPSMAASLKCWMHRDIPISVVPFASVDFLKAPCKINSVGQNFDFVYVASGEPHKNHENLLEAWRLLAETGCKPSLALTLDEDAYPRLCAYISRLSATHDLSVTNLGMISRDSIGILYRDARAMIYPSVTESFGLPLIEATQWGLPILASELDYVRDVIEPVESFDPNSPVSIARAVKRFLGIAEAPIKVTTTEAFLDEVLR